MNGFIKNPILRKKNSGANPAGRYNSFTVYPPLRLPTLATAIDDALTEFGLDAVAAFQGCVQAGDGIAHALKMRWRSPERE